MFSRKALYILLALIGLSFIAIIYCNMKVNNTTKKYVYTNIESVPYNKVGLVLGASKLLRNGNSNLYFKYRIEATKKLYDAEKISYIIVSGDNHIKSYNEPEDMMEALISLGIPKEKIYLDYAGLRTHDSVIRCKEIFGQNSFTIISQKFHNERAIYIALNNGLNAVGFNANDVSAYSGFKTSLREKLARVKLFLDIYLLNTSPKFLGDKVFIPN